MLILTRKLKESVMIGDDVVITILNAGGNQVSIGIDAPRDIEIYREEIYNRIKEEQKIKKLG